MTKLRKNKKTVKWCFDESGTRAAHEISKKHHCIFFKACYGFIFLGWVIVGHFHFSATQLS